MKLAIVGTGRIARRFVRELNEVDNVCVSAVVNPNTAHAQEFIDGNLSPETAGSVCAVGSLDEVVGKADAVYIASPHESHYEYCVQAFDRGLHVLCEKPLAFSSAHVADLYERSSAHGLVFMEAIKTAYCPGFKSIEETVARGDIGDVVDVEAAFTRLTAPGGREYTDTLYGGAFTEFGSYCMLPIFRFLGTEYGDVSFMSQQAYDVDGYTKASFDYGDRFGTAKTGLSVKSEGQLLISGTEGYILVPSPWWLTKYYEVRYEDPSRIARCDCEFAGDGLRYEIGEFVRRISEQSIEPAGRERNETIARATVYERFLAGRMR